METFSFTAWKEVGGRRDSEMKQDPSLGAESDVKTVAISSLKWQDTAIASPYFTSVVFFTLARGAKQHALPSNKRTNNDDRLSISLQ